MYSRQGDRPESIPRRLDDHRLLSLLRERPAGWKVHELSAAADRLDQPPTGPTPPTAAEAAGDLRLFQRNFRLMRQLYLLRRQLRAAGSADLHISSMDIRLCQPERGGPAGRAGGPETRLPADYDGLEAYYLEEANYYGASQASVQELLDSFWRQLENWRQRDTALKAWGIDPALPYDAVKQRILELAKRHHPDGGGDAAAFRSLWRFWEDYRDGTGQKQHGG